MSGLSEEPVRVQLRRTKGWRMPPNTVRVARPGRWGNQFKIGEDHSYYMRGAEIATAEQCVSLFRDHMEAWVQCIDADFLEPLRGKNLACFCRLDQPCHADVLLDLANRPRTALSSEHDRRET